MNPQLWGWQHLTYLAVFITLAVIALVLAKKFLKTQKSQEIFLKCLAGILLICIVANRVSIVFKTQTPEWKWLVPNSLCGMSSLVLALAVLIGKKDNNVLHFIWLLAVAGGLITMIYPDFIGQNQSFFYLPTITGLLHHSFSALTVIALFLFGNLNLTYKKWYCPVFGFTSLLAFGTFLIHVCGFSDAYHIAEPLLSGTPLTIWVVAPIAVVVYAVAILVAELVRKKRAKNAQTTNA